MKVRMDFISNSSSCSFIVEEPKQFVKFILAEFDVDSLSEELDKISMRIYANESSKDIFMKIVDNVENAFYWNNEVSAYVTFNELASFDDDFLDCITHIEFECDNYDNEEVAKLSILKRALKNASIKVGGSSEHDLLFEDENDDKPSPMMKLCALAFGNVAK